MKSNQTSTVEESVLLNLGLTDEKLFQLNIDHFTENEGEGRDQIVEQYFGKDGMTDLINAIISSFDSQNISSLLDLGSGSGTFLHPIAQRIRPDQVVALDATPKMLELIGKKFADHPISGHTWQIIGDMEQISKSLELNREHYPSLPQAFSVILSTLALHHIPSTEKVLAGISDHLAPGGKAVLIDGILSATSSMEPSDEHAHDGFDVDELVTLSRKYFSSISLNVLDIKCRESSTKEGTDLFLLELSDPKS